LKSFENKQINNACEDHPSTFMLSTRYKIPLKFHLRSKFFWVHPRLPRSRRLCSCRTKIMRVVNSC